MTSEGIPFGLVERHTAGAVRLGLSLDKLLSDSTIVRRFGDDRDVISPAQYLLLCLNTLLGIEDASHGLAKAGLGPSYPAIGLRMASAYSTLGEALTALCRLYSMASTGMQFSLSCQQATATLSVRIEAWSDQDAAQIEETQLGWLFMNCLHFLGRAPPVSQVVVRDPTHFNLGDRHWAIGGLVRHGSTTAFSFPRQFLATPPAGSAGPQILWTCHRRWLEFVKDRAPLRPVSDYVGDDGFIRFADIVRASGQSANTVRQRLKSGQGAFRDARQRALVEAIRSRLSSTTDSVDAIAADYGYSDARSFRRFFKNATGLTPHQVRGGSEAAPPPEDAKALEKLKAMTEQMNI